MTNKITMATLPQATAQEVFDQVATHLLTQNEKCVGENGICNYRAGNLACAAGCLISDEEYNPAFEGKRWIAIPSPDEHSHLIGDLQRVHDCYFPSEWAFRLYCIAKAHGLDERSLPCTRD